MSFGKREYCAQWLTNPNFFHRCVNLQELVLTENYIGELPDSIGALTRLNNLNVDRNRLEYLPPAVGNLVQVCGGGRKYIWLFFVVWRGMYASRFSENLSFGDFLEFLCQKLFEFRHVFRFIHDFLYFVEMITE